MVLRSMQTQTIRKGQIQMTKFEAGKTYTTRSACDSNVVWSFEVIKRTAKRITVVEDSNTVRTVGVTEMGGHEVAWPLGKYSMAPIIRASRQA